MGVNLEFVAVCAVNEVERPMDGGQVRLAFGIPTGQKADGLTFGLMVVGYSQDDPMRIWPSTRKDMEGRRFRVRVEEIAPEGPAA